MGREAQAPRALTRARRGRARHTDRVPLRLLQVVVPKRHDVELEELLKTGKDDTRWAGPINADQLLATVLLDAAEAEPLLDTLDDRFGAIDGYRALLLPLEATRPKLPEPAKPEPPPPEAPPETKPKKRPTRVSRDELEDDIASAVRLDTVFIVMVLLSAVVATVGLAAGNVPALIGAMVIAPLLGPNVALALGTTLGDTRLIHRALACNLAGGAVAVLFALAIGLVIPVDPNAPELVARTLVGPGDIALALASGAAGALAFTAGAPMTLVGVMVAVALLPPTVAIGLLASAGQWGQAGHAAMLLATNLICVNLSGTLTFLMRGVRPHSWWEADRANRSTRRAVIIWIVLLAALALLLTLSDTSRAA